MPKIICISGPCGSGKTTFTDALARHLAEQDRKTVYVIHGDSFHRGFVEPEEKEPILQEGQASGRVPWEEILRFTWDCITAMAERALRQGLDVMIDYVIENELPRILDLAAENLAELDYIVLTADADEIVKRIRNRGDAGLTGRALFLKKELEAMPENQGHLYDNTGKAPEDMIREINPDKYRVGPSGRSGDA